MSKFLDTKGTLKAAQKLTPSQFCSKNALKEAIFLKNGNFGTDAIVVFFLPCFCARLRFYFDGI